MLAKDLLINLIRLNRLDCQNSAINKDTNVTVAEVTWIHASFY